MYNVYVYVFMLQTASKCVVLWSGCICYIYNWRGHWSDASVFWHEKVSFYNHKTCSLHPSNVVDLYRFWTFEGQLFCLSGQTVRQIRPCFEHFVVSCFVVCRRLAIGFNNICRCVLTCKWYRYVWLTRTASHLWEFLDFLPSLFSSCIIVYGNSSMQHSVIHVVTSVSYMLLCLRRICMIALFSDSRCAMSPVITRGSVQTEGLHCIKSHWTCTFTARFGVVVW